MITAQLTKVSTEEDLITGALSYRLGFKLPTGDVVYAEASTELILSLRKYVENEGAIVPKEPPRPPPTVEIHEPHGTQPAPGLWSDMDPDVEEGGNGEDPTLTEWRTLPESVLPHHVKVALTLDQPGLPERIPLQNVIQIRDALLGEYTDEDWKRLGFSEGPTGTVSWEEGVTRQPHMVPSRSVPADAGGSPIAPRTAPEIDPGEIAVTDGDEDGTNQF